MFDIPAYVVFVAQSEYEVSFTIKKPYTKTSETVKANSPTSARHIIEAQYGKDNIIIHSVKQLKK